MLEHYVAVIQAGGMGTRMRELTQDRIPKPLLALNGKSMIEWQLENVKKYGVHDFVIIIGHLGDKIREYFEDGSKWGVHISYLEESQPLGSAGALFWLKDRLAGQNCILIFGDVMFDVALDRMARFHEEHRALATLAVHPNTHPQDSDLVILDKEGCVIGFDAKTNARAQWYHNLVNAGLYILSGDLLKNTLTLQRMDLERELLLPNIGTKRIYGYRTTEYIKDAGTPDRFREVGREQQAGLWQRKNLNQKQKCVFLDRDGTINVYKGLLSNIDDLELEKNAAQAISRLNRSGYLAIVVTNQPVVARGMCSIEDVNRIHAKMETLLGQQGAYVDDIVFCPHHPDKGFPEENVAYKIPCTCRKPDIGMIQQMAEKYHIDLSESYMIGDSTVDIQTGFNAGLRTILLRTGQAGTDGKYQVIADAEAEDLLEAVNNIIKKGEL